VVQAVTPLVFELELPLSGAAGVLAVLFSIVLVMPRVAERVRMPALVGLLAGGIVIGPSGVGAIERDGAVALLGAAGLLFLMFEAGLEMDRTTLRHERRQTVVFGVLTFAAPFVLGLGIHLWLDYSWLASLLLASCWSSHTLLSYPVFQRARVVANRSVTVALGGTLITDTAALLVLVVIARIHQGDLTPTFAVTVLPLIAGAGVAITVALPRFAAWFFASIGQERSARFLFVMVALFGSAGLAQVVGVEPIIGAFLAGLALNRLVVPGSALAGQVGFFGSNLLTPVFMISVGMLVDPGLLVADPETLTRAAGFTVAVVVGKLVASALTGQIYGWRRAEVGALFSLSVAQAAATLAAVFVGYEIGLLDESSVNAVIIVILVTCVVSSLVGSTVASRLPPPPVRVDRLGERVLVPLENPAGDESTIMLAAALTWSDAGTVIPLTVLDVRATPHGVRETRQRLVDGAERTVLARGGEARSEVRLDASTAAGVVHAAIEHDATCVVLAWNGRPTRRESFFGRQVDALLVRSPVPVLVVRSVPVTPHRRVVLALDDTDMLPGGRPGAKIAASVAVRLAAGLRAPLVVCRTVDDGPLVEIDGHAVEQSFTAGDGDLETLLESRTNPGDIIVKGLPTIRAGVGAQYARLVRSLEDRSIVAASPPRTGNGMITGGDTP
jgi:Kef-type K+ transport system membrane component KefB/nucleotide-binding universal stress UspA family protein